MKEALFSITLIYFMPAESHRTGGTLGQSFQILTYIGSIKITWKTIPIKLCKDLYIDSITMS